LERLVVDVKGRGIESGSSRRAALPQLCDADLYGLSRIVGLSGVILKYKYINKIPMFTT
jgi:hypothetical protein